MSHVNIYVHAVWSTKWRFPTLVGKNRLDLLNHIRETAGQNSIRIDHINGGDDHLHALLSLNSDQSIGGVLNIIKGESSYWINKYKAEQSKFAWQRQYWAVSVGISQLKSVRDYIRDQEAHHHLISFEEEKQIFIKEFGLEEIED